MPEELERIFGAETECADCYEKATVVDDLMIPTCDEHSDVAESKVYP